MASKTSNSPRIRRILSAQQQEQTRKHAGFLIEHVLRSHGEMGMQLRNNYFNIYYKGNSLLKVTPIPKQDRFRIEVDPKFGMRNAVVKLDDKRLDVCEIFPNGADSSIAIVRNNQARLVLQKKVLNTMMSAIKKGGFGEEITFEQSLMTDNMEGADFIILDRQVQAEGTDRKKLDLLAARRIQDGLYQFVAVEVKLGRNPELAGPVANQLSGYVARIEENFDDYAQCYSTNHAQKHALGLFSQVAYPEHITFTRPVDSMLVVGLYSMIGERHIARLLKAHPELTSRIVRCWHPLK